MISKKEYNSLSPLQRFMIWKTWSPGCDGRIVHDIHSDEINNGYHAKVIDNFHEALFKSIKKNDKGKYSITVTFSL